MFSYSPECKGEDRVIQPTGDVITTEGETVTLGCTFETTTGSPTLFWYKQEVNDYPKYMLKCFSKTADKSPEFQNDRFDAKINKTSVPLKFQKLQLSDSAVYYCALRPTTQGGAKLLLNYRRESNFYIQQTFFVFSDVSFHSNRYVRLCSMNKFDSNNIYILIRVIFYFRYSRYQLKSVFFNSMIMRCCGILCL
uniref:Ig-like domain-containing protein n=1 Tax=Sander lucioperca TaxID=283035 RepID=A0A8D0DGY9_SANLU